MPEHPENRPSNPRRNTFGVPKLREKVLDALSKAYVNSLLDTEEYENRVELAHKSRTVEELTELVHDFPDKHEIVAPFLPQASRQRTSESLSSTQKRPLSKMPQPTGERKLKGLTLLGNKYLLARDCVDQPGFAFTAVGDLIMDLRDIKPGQIVDMTHISLIGDLKIMLPEGVKVEQNYMVLIGEFKRKFLRRKKPEVEGSEQAYLRITGVKLIGDLRIEYY